MTNTNCLEGIRCPNCGQEDRFFVVGCAEFEVTDDGSDAVGDHEWDDGCSTRCPECGFDGELKEFRKNPDLPPEPDEMSDKHAPWAGAYFIGASGERYRYADIPVEIDEGAGTITYEAEFRRRPELPADPDGKNEDRAAWAGAALAKFMELTETDLEDAVGDLLTDLMHWSYRNNYDFDAALDRARFHYESETTPESSP